LRAIGRGHDVFVAHAKADADRYAGALHEVLKKHRLDVFYDDEALVAGDSLPPSIRRALERASALVVVASPRGLESPWVTREVAAFRRSHPHPPRLLRISFHDGAVDPGHPHADVFRELLALREDPRALAAGLPTPEIVSGIVEHFGAMRKRLRRWLASGGLALVICAAAVWAWIVLDREQRAAEIERWTNYGDQAAQALRFDLAELAYAHAWHLSDGAAALRDDYLAARQHRFLRPSGALETGEQEIVLHLLGRDDEPVVVTEDSGRVQLRSRERSKVMGEGEPGLVEVESRDGWLALRLPGIIRLRVTAFEGPSRDVPVDDTLEDFALYDAHLAVLGRVGDELVARRVPLAASTAAPADIRLPLPEGAVTTVGLLGDTFGVFAAGDSRADTGGYMPTVWLWRSEAIAFARTQFESFRGYLPQCYHAWVSPSARSVALALSPLDTGSLLAPSGERTSAPVVFYARLDDPWGRSWRFHHGYLKPQFLERGFVDIVFLIEDGDLKWIVSPPAAVLEAQPVTLASRVSTFIARPPERSGQYPTVFAADEVGWLTVLIDGRPWSRYSIPSGPARVMESRDGSLLMVQTAESVLFWRIAEPAQGEAVPAVEQLEKELDFRLQDVAAAMTQR
jgi:hypothetical protein